MTLERLGFPVKRGAAVGAAEGVFQEAISAGATLKPPGTEGA
jgi:hypothetical protein